MAIDYSFINECEAELRQGDISQESIDRLLDLARKGLQHEVDKHAANNDAAVRVLGYETLANELYDNLMDCHFLLTTQGRFSETALHKNVVETLDKAKEILK